MLLEAVQMLRNRLPRSWSLYEAPEPASPKDIGVDAELRLGAEDGAETVVLVQAKRLLNTRDVPIASRRCRGRRCRLGGGEELVLVLAARYLAAATQGADRRRGRRLCRRDRQPADGGWPAGTVPARPWR